MFKINNNNLQKLLLSNEKNKDENKTNKKINKSYNKYLLSGIINNEESTIISDNNNKKNIINKSINQEGKKENYYKSFINEKNIFHAKEKKLFSFNKQINVYKIINDKNKNDIINIESKSEKKINTYKNDIFNKKINNNENIYNNTDDNNYNLINIRTDKNNHKYKELYIYKNLKLFLI